jgi:hypothetical protein
MVAGSLILSNVAARTPVLNIACNRWAGTA